MMRLKTLSAASFGVAVVATTGAASAQTASDYVIILLDATGSMYPENWKTAINHAKASVQEYVDLGQNAVTRGFAVYTFKTDSLDGQNGIKQVWPTPSTSCTQIKPGGAATTFCSYPALDEYTHLLGSGSPGEFDTVISPTYGPKDGMPRTPLARSMCSVIDAMKLAAGSTNATIVLESDGQENETPLTDACGGPPAEVAASFVVDSTKDDYGFPLVGADVSWQAKVIRRALQYNSPAPDLGTPRKGAMPPNLAWKVSSIFTFYPATSTFQALQLAAQPSTGQLSPFELPDGAQPTFTQQLVRAAAGYSPVAAPAASAASGGTTSMSPAELGLFRALGKANTRSRYTEFVTVSGQTPVYGVNHPVAGDVDDSGCSDIADLRVIKQKDVWLKFYDPAKPIQAKADLNRDGWVNQDDIPILKANWGKGCKYPVQPFPPKY